MVGDHVYLKVSPMKGTKRFGMKGKLAPHSIGSFPILEKCGTAIVIGRGARYLPRVPVKEVYKGIYGCSITGSGTTQG
jgi:hypothetical protein